MAEKQFDFSIIMEDEEKSSSIPKDVWGGIPIKEDKKGPKTIAVVLFLGAILVLFQSYQDFLLHHFHLINLLLLLHLLKFLLYQTG